jgi:hypothetical protein
MSETAASERHAKIGEATGREQQMRSDRRSGRPDRRLVGIEKHRSSLMVNVIELTEIKPEPFALGPQ